MTGRFYDEWQIGDRIEHPIRRTVTETDNLLFSAMTHNPQPLHIDAKRLAQRRQRIELTGLVADLEILECV